jgi:hypothetical protein
MISRASTDDALHSAPLFVTSIAFQVAIPDRESRQEGAETGTLSAVTGPSEMRQWRELGYNRFGWSVRDLPRHSRREQ